jgi:signal peptidase
MDYSSSQMIHMKRVLRFLRWFFNLTFAALLLLLGSALLAPAWLDLDLRAVASGSMEPKIPLGSVVVIQPVEAASIQLGQVVTYRSPEMPAVVVTHRVVEVVLPEGGEAVFRTQGDANDEPDLELIAGSDVLGRVLFHLPYLGILSQFVRTRQGWAILVLLPAGMIILMEVVSILKLIWSPGEQISRGRSSSRLEKKH